MTDVRTEDHGGHIVHVLEDAKAGSSARILAEYGFNCYSFRCRVAGRERELMRSDDHFADQPSRASGNGTPILFPFPNRIRGGRFDFGGRTFELPLDRRGVNAIHGLVIDRRWRVIANPKAAGGVTGQFQLTRDAPDAIGLWPEDFVIEMTYELEANRLTSHVRVTNPGSKSLPWGFGTHPYFRLPLDPGGDESRCRVIAPVGESWELSEFLPTGRCLPVNQSTGLTGNRPLSELKFDDVFTALKFDGDWCTCRMIDETARVEVVFRFDRSFRELVIYTPPNRGAVCLEPYTCVTDAVNLQPRGIDAGLRVLEPGESAKGTMVLEAKPLD
jgi:aldose 1-epimerase